MANEKIITVEAGKMSSEGLQKWATNTLKFAAPLGIMYLTFVVGNINVDGFQVIDFQPSQLVIGGLILYILNAIMDLLRKLAVEQKYIVEK